jgi:threonine/homoserine/homoserine lactone efflux protein
MAVVTKNALAHGRRGVLLTTTGILGALLLWVTATALGVAALVATSAVLFGTLKLAGAAYLAYLGVQAWIASRRAKPLAAEAAAVAPAASVLRQGFLSCITNPKLGVFFVTLLPQFVPPGARLVPRLLLLGAVFGVIGWAWMNLYGLLVTRLRDVMGAPGVRRWMERLTGTVLIGLGARLAFERL